MGITEGLTVPSRLDANTAEGLTLLPLMMFAVSLNNFTAACILIVAGAARKNSQCFSRDVDSTDGLTRRSVLLELLEGTG